MARVRSAQKHVPDTVGRQYRNKARDQEAADHIFPDHRPVHPDIVRHKDPALDGAKLLPERAPWGQHIARLHRVNPTIFVRASLLNQPLRIISFTNKDLMATSTTP